MSVILNESGWQCGYEKFPLHNLNFFFFLLRVSELKFTIFSQDTWLAVLLLYLK